METRKFISKIIIVYNISLDYANNNLKVSFKKYIFLNI